MAEGTCWQVCWPSRTQQSLEHLLEHQQLTAGVALHQSTASTRQLCGHSATPRSCPGRLPGQPEPRPRCPGHRGAGSVFRA